MIWLVQYRNLGITSPPLHLLHLLRNRHHSLNILALHTLIRLLPPPKRRTSLVAFAKAKAWVEEIQSENTSTDNRALETDKVLLRLDQVASPAFAKLRNTTDSVSKNHLIMLECG